MRAITLTSRRLRALHNCQLRCVTTDSPRHRENSALPARSKATYAASLHAALANPPLELGVSPFDLIKKDLKLLSGSLKQLVQSDHPVLTTVAEYLLCGSEGKRIRPSLVLLMSRACSNGREPNAKQQRLAEITEMIHTASLLHDDVVDLSDTRRNQPTAHVNFGNKVAILGGDFLLARASIQLARLRDVEVIEMLSTVIEHLVKGEIMQMRDSWECVSSMDHYMEKTFMKTGSLIAHSCKASVLLGDHSPETAEIAYQYGRHVGMAFQALSLWMCCDTCSAASGRSA